MLAFAKALHALLDNPEFQVVALLTTVTEGFDRISMHGVRRELLHRQAESIGLPVQEIVIPPGRELPPSAQVRGAADLDGAVVDVEITRFPGLGVPPAGRVIAMSAIYRTDSPPGVAGRWFIERLKQEDAARSKERTVQLAAPGGLAAKPRRPATRRSLARRR